MTDDGESCHRLWMAKSKKPRRDIYQEITNRIVERLEAGDLPPWRQPIKSSGGDPFPKNLTTGKTYRGINVWLLGLTAWLEGYDSNEWATFRQCRDRGGQVRKGERGTLVTFWKEYTKEDPITREETTLPVLKHYTVFNAEQIDGIESSDTQAAEIDVEPFIPIEQAQAILDGYAGCPPIEHRGNRAAYLPLEDKIVIAPPTGFVSPEEYYGTLYHEGVHASGHSSRLDRGIDTDLAPFGSPDYSKEELVAEMGSAYLCAFGGISPPTIEQSAAYLAGWLSKLKQDKKLLVQAAGQAQKAADHILGVTFGEAAGGDRETKRTVSETPSPEPRDRVQRDLGFG